MAETTNTVPASAPAADRPDANKPAGIAPATSFAPSGAPMQTVPDVDPNHPAVDANPRERTTVEQNKIDFNDPTISGAEAVARNLQKQGIAVKREDDERSGA